MRLNFADIQGNILRGYNFGAGAHYFVEVPDPRSGRALLRGLLAQITNARTWTSRPVIATNIALTYAGLRALGVDESVLEELPAAFTEPLVDRGDNPGEDGWDAGILGAHMLVLLASSEEPKTGESMDDRFPKLAGARGELKELLNRTGARPTYVQEVEALPNAREHFGYADGYGQPAVEGMPANRAGQGVPEQQTWRWRDIKAGEFILGYENEDGECISGAAAWLQRNGSYMVYRKLEQDVAEFRRRVDEHAERYAQAVQAADPGKERVPALAAWEWMAAKLVGRWRDGIALELYPEPGSDRDQDLERESHRVIDNDFRYRPDRDGYICPQGAHIRRANPRDLLGGAGQESRRHRIIRRGMPYGRPYPSTEDADGESAPAQEKRGLIFMCFNADIERQFEVVQAQWCNDGNAFGLGDDQDYLVGNRTTGKLILEGDPPFFVSKTPSSESDVKSSRLVRTRGCQYLLMPGLNALRRLSAPPSSTWDLEEVPDAEPVATLEVVNAVTEQMLRTYSTSRPVMRGQHPKPHGCVKAEFIVEDVPEDLRHGLFAEFPKTYEAWIRFSASHAALQSDVKPDAQGMAIKVLDVKGQTVLAAEPCAQDFILVNHDVFFLRNAMEVAAFARAVTAAGGVRGAGTDVRRRAVQFFLRWNPRGLPIIFKTLRGEGANPLTLRYWSQTPYALGDLAVKYSVRPPSSNGKPEQKPEKVPRDYDWIEDALDDALRPPDAKFDLEFLVQRQADPREMPVEDPTVRWSEDESPFCRVALIRISHQDMRSQALRNWGENLIFTPWHTLWEHRPLGGINRVRLAVYEESARLRHEMNGTPEHDPCVERPPAG